MLRKVEQHAVSVRVFWARADSEGVVVFLVVKMIVTAVETMVLTMVVTAVWLRPGSVVCVLAASSADVW